MTSINVNLTGQTVLDIVNALADSANLIDKAARSADQPRARHLRSIGRQLLRAKSRVDTHSQLVAAVIVGDGWKPEDPT